MNINTRLKLSVSIPVIMALVIMVALIFSYQEMSRVQEAGDTVRQIRSSITELNHLVFSYTLYHEERPKQQFFAEHEYLTGLIENTQLLHPQQQQLLDKIRQNNQTMEALFIQLVSAYESGDTTGAGDRLTGLLLLRSYEADTSAAVLRGLLDADTRTTEIRTVGLILLVLGLASVPLTIVLKGTRQGIMSSLSNLSEGAAVIGSGNLDYKIEEKGSDEITDLCRTFNRMTSNLKAVTASKADLEIEIEVRKKAEEALKQSEEKFRIVSDFTHDWEYWRSPDNRFIYMSPSCLRFTGYSNTEFIDDFYLYLRIVHPDDLARVELHMLEDMQNMETAELEFRIIRRDGQQRWLGHVCQPIIDAEGNLLGRRSSNRDITKRKEAEEQIRELVEELKVHQEELEAQTEELRQSREEIKKAKDNYLDLYDYAPVGYLTLEKDSSILEANLTAAGLLGLKRDELVHSKFGDFIAADSQEAFFLHVNHVLETDARQKCEIRMHGRNGSMFYAQLESIAAHSTGIQESIRTSLSDITDRKKADHIKDEFIGMVSHELRTPLTVITGAIRTAMLEGLQPEELSLLLNDAALGAESLADILDNLLELSRYQAKRLLLTVEPIDIHELATSMVEQVQSKSSTHQFIVDKPEYLPPVQADKVRIGLILHNLIENAVKYSPLGGKVRIFFNQDNGCLTVGVSDQGIGISPEDQPRLFQPFQRLERLEQQGIKGLGLGLIVCRRLVEAHHGRIWVESEPGKGSTFYFSLPNDEQGSIASRPEPS
ncbi:MAG: PAS domain S-box protein [Dehalococcoidaceae bacterium]|nr:PAS domain S-box protein [Dehalococcoidaceae bacterium]